MQIKKIGIKFIPITSEYAGQRIDNFLVTRLKGLPKSRIYRLLRKGQVRVNKKRIKPEYKIKNGDEVRVPPIHIKNTKKNLLSGQLNHMISLSNSILYEDDDLLILNKCSGMAVHGGSGLSFGVIEGMRLLRSKDRFLELIHRLDRYTSGILLIAKNRAILRLMNEQLYKKLIQKDYLALVRGEWPLHLNVVHAPLKKNILHSGKHMVYISSQGKPSETHFKVEERFGFATLVRASPITGRTHQIRVHTLHSGHPIALDDRYGDCKFDRQLAFTGLSRLFLHAVSITFIHPYTGINLRIEAPLDNTLEFCLSKLRQYHRDH